MVRGGTESRSRDVTSCLAASLTQCYLSLRVSFISPSDKVKHVPGISRIKEYELRHSRKPLHLTKD